MMHKSAVFVLLMSTCLIGFSAPVKDLAVSVQSSATTSVAHAQLVTYEVGRQGVISLSERPNATPRPSAATPERASAAASDEPDPYGMLIAGLAILVVMIRRRLGGRL